MKLEKAIEIIEKLQEPIETTEPLEGTGLSYPIRVPPEEVCLGEQEHEALELARFNLKRMKDVVGKVREEIDKLDKLEQQGTLTAEQYMVRTDLKWFLTLLTEGE